MDGAAANILAGNLLEQEFPTVFSLRDASHTLDLAVEAIGKMKPFEKTIKQQRSIINLFRQRHAPAAVFKEKSNLRLLMPGDTRFYTAFIAATRLVQVRTALKRALVDPKFEAWQNKPHNRQKAGKVVALINSRIFWDRLHLFVKIVKPIVRIIRLADSNMPTIGKIWPECEQVEKFLHSLDMGNAQLAQDVCGAFRACWDQLHSPLHSAAYVLDPQFQTTDFPIEVVSDFKAVLRRLLPDDVYQEALLERSLYSNQEGSFSDRVVMSLASCGERAIPVYQWWFEHGHEAPQLRKVAQRLTACVWSSGATERVWSSYDFIHSKKRNRLNADRAVDLVYVFRNSQLIQKQKDPVKFPDWVQELQPEEADLLEVERQLELPEQPAPDLAPPRIIERKRNRSPDWEEDAAETSSADHSSSDQ